MNFNLLAEQLLSNMQSLQKTKQGIQLSEGIQGEGFILEYLYQRREAAMPGEISSEMGVSTARIAVALNGLENKGYITREIDKNDRRRIIVNLTEKGKNEAIGQHCAILEKITEALEFLGEQDAKNFVRIIEKFHAMNCK